MFRKLIPTLTADESDILKFYMKARKSKAGTVIMEMGDTNRDIFFFIDGQYDIYQRITVKGQSLALHLASLQGPGLLGEANLFLDEERQATVLASGECKYFLLTIKNIEIIKKDHPIIAMKIMEHAGQIVTQRLRDVQNNIYNRLMNTSETPESALHKMNTYIGPTKSCSIKLAQKLFPKESLKSTWKESVSYKKDES